jgi:hypothetical protein
MTAIHGGTGMQWQDNRVMWLVNHDERIWDMGMRLASIPLVDITTNAVGEIITDGPLPQPTEEFTRMIGFEYTRRGGDISEEVDAYSLALATLAVRFRPMEHHLMLRSEIGRPPVEYNEPTGNGPIAEPGGAIGDTYQKGKESL